MRGDLQIRDDVLAELDFEPTLKAAGVGVAVVDGVVTLSGFVESLAQRAFAEDAVKRVRGVRGVAQEIEVRLPFESRTDDATLASRVRNVLDWHLGALGERIDVEVSTGHVTLSGQARHAHQRDLAGDVVKVLTGVAGLTNAIQLAAEADADDIKARISAALARSAALSAAGIEVEVDAGRVTLNGKVQSWRDRKAAETAAWTTPGVVRVIDHLRLL